MNAWDESTTNVDERIERLISRSLDGELSGHEQAELDNVLLCDADARALFDDYRRNDRAASAALAWDFGSVRTVVAKGPRRGLWLATAGAVLAAAAVVALSFVPSLWSGSTSKTAYQPTPASKGIAPAINEPTLVDYRDAGFAPLQRYRDLNRDVIGIPGRDGNTIYIFERNVQSTRVTPISGDF